MLESLPPIGPTIPSEVEEVTPQLKTEESSNTYGKFVVEPLKRGYGITVGNPLRRVLLSSIPGTAITWVKIDGVLHEYSSIPGVKEEVMDLLLRIKGIRIRSVTGRPGKMRLEVKGEGRVCAGDISASADFEIINPELHLATLDSPDSALSIEFNVEQGKGYQQASQRNGLPVGALPVDAIFSPVKRVNYILERTRVGQVTDYERLVLEMWTDGSTTPIEAVRQAAELLVNHFFLFVNAGKEPQVVGEAPLIRHIPVEVYQTPIEKLELSARTFNALKRNHINKIGEVLERTKEELLSIRNFGDKSLQELYSKLRAHGFLPPEKGDADAPSEQEEPQETEA